MQLSVDSRFDFDSINTILTNHGFGDHGNVQKVIDNAVIRWCIDLSGKADKKKPSKAGNLAALDANGNLADSGKAGANVAVKAKPSKAGNLAALTADGSLSDSGIDPATKADLQDGKTKTAQMAKSFTFDKTTVKFNY